MSGFQWRCYLIAFFFSIPDESFRIILHAQKQSRSTFSSICFLFYLFYFTFNDKSLHTKYDSERSSVSLNIVRIFIIKFLLENNLQYLFRRIFVRGERFRFRMFFFFSFLLNNTYDKIICIKLPKSIA